ncbi:MAG: hypothetical protein LBI66_10325 [Burkholderiaceae bacterium]|jgi:hypothetical protein|nr:hypothetical protein [Burkholderiaceae bacterium]
MSLFLPFSLARALRAGPRRTCAALAGTALLLAGCGSVGGGVGIGIPVGPVSVGVGLGSGGLSAGVGTGVGPVGVGVGVNQSGQVIGGAGVGASTGVGGARVGVGVGSSTVLHDPRRAEAPAVQESSIPQASGPAEAAGSVGDGDPAAVQWRDASGRVVPACRVEGRC